MAPGSAPLEPAHSGLYVHLQAGGGYTSISGADSYGNPVKIAGSGPSFTVAIGGAVAPNFALFGSLFFTMASQPHITQGAYQADATGDATVGGFGGGAVYYFMPVDIYLSAALGAVDLEGDDGNGTTRTITDLGLAFQGLVGKEWPVSDHWGLGAALEFVTASMKDKNDSGITWKADAFNLLFSATYF
jgi:hypothetical protein